VSPAVPYRQVVANNGPSSTSQRISDPLALRGPQRVLLGIGGCALAIAGLVSLLAQKQDGVATLAILVAGAAFLLISFIGQIPGTMWTRFARTASEELLQFRTLRARIEADEIMRTVAQVAATERVRLEFGARSQAWAWDAMVTTEDGRAIGVTYVGPDGVMPPHFDQAVTPDRVESAVLVIFNGDVADSRRWNIVAASVRRGGHTLTPAAAGSPIASSTRLSVCGPEFTNVYQHLDTLIIDRVGGTGQNTEVQLVTSSSSGRDRD